MLQLHVRMAATRLYGMTIFLSAFLLFQIQPLIGRHLLPWFGGATAVWATSLLFFTTVLFLGYAYTYYVSRLPHRLQARIHLSVLAAGAIIVIAYPLLFQSVYPPLAWTLESTLSPALTVLLALAMSIGIPYFILSTTGPLVQHWFGVQEEKEPYHLYALSNAASFLALGTYPFIIEPAFTLGFQKAFWTALFLLFAGLYAYITVSFLRRAQSHPSAFAADETESLPWSIRLRWVGFAALPTILLVATTAQLTQVVAPVPFLWVIPLALYLITFIFAFRGWGSGGVVAALTLGSAVAAFLLLGWTYEAVTRQMLSYLALFFFTSLFCHARLYEHRPTAVHSALFYLCISFGGMVGTILVSIVAPIIFTDITEFPLGVLIAAGVAITFFPAMRYIRDEYERSVAVLRILALIAVLTVGIYHFHTQEKDYSYISRNFYGVVKITDTGYDRNLLHGTTFHGKQSRDPAKAFMPSTYYVPLSGIGRAIAYEQSAHTGDAITVGAIGLGTGTLASYCRRGDQFVFYEIDARIEAIARDQFTYLDYCKHSEVRIGDGRLLLERERREKAFGAFDVLAIDAFSDDTIPAHLLTQEAVALYFDHLKDTGILAVHTSNRYLKLGPVVTRIAHKLGLASVVIDYPGDSEGGTFSQWVLLARNPAIFSKPAFVDATSSPSLSAKIAPLWTDDYMNILSVLNLPAIYRIDD